MHHALRPLTVFVRYWPQLVACYLLGVLGRKGAIELAAWAGHDNDFWASLIMPMAGIARLGSYVAMFLVIRGGFPELAAPTRGERRFDLFATVVVPFFAIYLAWQMFKEDWLAFEARALTYYDPFAASTPGSTVLHPESLPVSTGTLLLIIGALVLRFTLTRFEKRLPSWTVPLRLYVDATWVFLVLTFAVNRGLTWLLNPAGWIAQRRIVVWFDTTRAELFSHAQPLEVAWSGLMWALRTAFGGATVPLLWLAVAAIVYGVSAETTWRAAARRVAGARVEVWYDRAAPTGRRWVAPLTRTPTLLRDKAVDYGRSQLGKFAPIADAARLIAHGGVVALALYVLAYLGLAWLDMAGSFYGTQLSPGYLFRGMAWLLGPQPWSFWMAVGDVLAMLSHMLIEPLRICLIAATLAYCVQHVAAAGERAATAGTAPESDRPGP